MTPKAQVIGYTKFIGVPEDLIDIADRVLVQDMRQDMGTDAGRLIECAGRNCYDSYGKGRSSQEYHENILQVAHGNILEHATLNFYLNGMSRGCTHELVRHRAGIAISQRSTRYVDESESNWAWHPLIEAAIRGMRESAGRGGAVEGELAALNTHAGNVYEMLMRHVSDYLIARGVDKVTARKQARGAARGALGNALETRMVWTANHRALRNVLEQRASPFADAEIRLLANAIYEAALPYCPEYLSDYTKAECPDGIGYALVSAHPKI